VRLSKLEVEQIIKAITPFLREQEAEIRLYGSRTNDYLKGGDIDLLLILDKSKSATILLAQKHQILAQIKGLIGEQKIDLKIASKQELKKDPFLKLIMPKSMLLHRWQ
jgi:predicted nucleotidyltransferase